MKKVDIACIIDDDPIFIFATQKMMQLIEFCEDFLIFNNGQEALNHLKPVLQSGRQIPEIILLDLNMPVMDGWGFLDEFTKIPSTQMITIYIVTSSINESDFERAAGYKDVDNYIVKPVTPDTLRTILENYS